MWGLGCGAWWWFQAANWEPWLLNPEGAILKVQNVDEGSPTTRQQGADRKPVHDSFLHLDF